MDAHDQPEILADSRLIEANGFTFRALRWGPAEAPPVLLLHGFPQQAETWATAAQALVKSGHCAYAFDQRGYSSGARPADPDAYNFTAFVADAIAVADGLGLKKFDLAGFGLGAAQAWMVAAQNVSRVRRLIALRFPHPAAFAWGLEQDPSQQRTWANFTRELGQGELPARVAKMLEKDGAGLRDFLRNSGLTGAWLDIYCARLKQPGALLGALSWENALSIPMLKNTPAVACPTLFLWSQGPALSESVVARTKNYVSGAYVVQEISGTGNFILENGAQKVIAPIEDFLRAHPL